MHDAVRTYVADKLTGLSPVDVLDLGGRDVNGSTRDLFGDVNYVVVDIAEGPGVDIVANAADLDLGRTFDVVLSTEVLEHTARAAEIVAAACRHVSRGGVFIATMAGPGRHPHGASGESSPPPGEHYENVAPDVLERWLSDAGFSSWDVDQLALDVRCIAWR